MKATKVKLVQKIDGRHVVSETAIENIDAFMSVRGFTQTGRKPAQAQLGHKSIAVREEIAGQPTFAELMGPAYDGEGVVRYEDWATYEDLSK
jgi:hypothetical protein